METDPYAAPLPAGRSHFEENIGNRIIIANCVCLIIIGLVLILRIYTRGWIVRKIGLDDIFMTIAFCFSLAMGVCSCYACKYGMGLHIWDVRLSQLSPYFLRYYLLSAILYSPAIGFAKVSILVLYLRLSVKPVYRYVCYGIMFFVFGYNTASIFANIFTCTPIASSWDLSVKSTSCINIHAVYYVNNSLNIVSDIAILVLPIPMIWQLQLPKRQRVGILAIFMTGGAVCIISIIRLWTLYDLIKSTDTTYVTVQALLWCIIEVNVGIVVGSASSVKPFVRRHLPALLGEYHSSHKTPTTSKPRSRINRMANYSGEPVRLHSLDRPEMGAGKNGANVTTVIRGPSYHASAEAAGNLFSVRRDSSSDDEESWANKPTGGINCETTVVVSNERASPFDSQSPVAHT